MKGALLEFIVRQTLIKCGFSSVKPDENYIFEKGNLFYINGKGAAHDADVLMNPPFQAPFFYPSRILFECKNYKNNIALSVARNALGLRYDINEFEIVTKKTIRKRINNRRSHYADRKRFVYQVGIAGVGNFTAPAIEFAVNNKIPIFSLEWFLSEDTCNLFGEIKKEYVAEIADDTKRAIHSFLKNKEINLTLENNDIVRNFIEEDEIIGAIIKEFFIAINNIYVGLVETGDLLFLRKVDFSDEDILKNVIENVNLSAELHYSVEHPKVWRLTVFQGNNRLMETDYEFFIPNRLLSILAKYSERRRSTIDFKEKLFKEIFIFGGSLINRNLPFLNIELDQHWLNQARERLNEENNNEESIEDNE